MLNENGGTGNMELDNNVWSRAGTGTMKNVPNLSHLTFPLFPGIVLYTHFLSQKTKFVL